MVGELIEKSTSMDKLFKKFKKTRSHIDKKTKFDAKLLTAKMQTIFEVKLSERVRKPKEL